LLPTTLVALALLVLLLPQPAAAQEEIVPRFEPAPCPVEAPAGVECGYLVVWEDRADPAEGTIQLAVAILPSESASPASDPIVYLEGGPGGSALEGLDTWLGSPFLAERDLILLEQRGTRYAVPELDCPELKETYVETWEAGLEYEAIIAREVAAAAECRDRLAAEGADLAAYHSAASAADLEDLRLALGYDAWNLYGISYGTRLALTVLRDYPEGVRSAILDSVYPPQVDGLVELAPNAERALSVLFADCRADPACAAAYPDLEATLYEVLARADEQPYHVRVPHPDTGEMLRLPVDGDDLVGLLFLTLYDAEIIPYLPLVIDRLHAGDSGVLVPLAHFALSTYLSGSDGMSYSVTCHEEAPFNTLAEAAAAARRVPEPLRVFPITGTLEICDLWGAGQAGPIETEPVRSEVPVLVLAGVYDPITPPAFAQAAAAWLPNSYYFEFPGLSHGVTLDECPAGIARDFLADPDTRPRASCLDAMASPGFRAGGDLYLTPATYRVLVALESDPGRLLIPLLAFVDLSFLILVFVTLRGLLRLVRRWPGATPRGAGLFHGTLGAVATLNLFTLALVAAAILSAIAGDWSVLVFGLPRWAVVVVAVQALAALLTLGLVMLLASAWWRRHWSIARRAVYTLAVVGLAAFFGFLATWDLLFIL
jgi:pimeloyl-ACP methyl ester carboxylesterase